MEYKIEFESSISDSQKAIINQYFDQNKINGSVSSNYLSIFADELADILPDLMKVFEQSKIEIEKFTHKFKVLNYSCASCALSTESVLKYTDGVISAEANYATESVTVTYLPQLSSPSVFKEKLSEIGFELIINDDFDFNKHKSENLNNLKQNLIYASLLAIPLFIVGMFFMHLSSTHYITWLLCTPLVFGFGRKFFVNAWQNFKLWKANMDTLVAVSTGTAYLFSVINLFFPHLLHLHNQVYFESSGLVIYFILLGKFLEESAKYKASDALKKLMDLSAKKVDVLVGAKWVNTVIENIKKGELIKIGVGENIALDGVIEEGQAYINEAFMSGESVPKLKLKGDNVFAGTTNLDGVLNIKVSRDYSNTKLANIIRKVETSLASKAPIQNKVDKIASIFVPLVILIAILSFLVWYFVFQNTQMAFLSFITVMVVACPCAMGLATPTALMVGIGKGAREGILIKDAKVLENSSKITDVVLDKTGTLTKGKPSVKSVSWFEKNQQLLSVLYNMEKASSHPLAKAVIENIGEQAILTFEKLEVFPGKGISATLGTATYFLGNNEFLIENGVLFSQNQKNEIKEIVERGHSLVLFSKNMELLAIFEIGDENKENIEEELDLLRKDNITLHLLSGDHPKTVAVLAEKLGIVNFYGGMLPNQKAEYILKLKNQAKVVAMVGDGINDTLAFVEANVSVAMSDGADVAKEVADITILGSELSRLRKAFTLSKQTNATIHQNLFWAFVYNILAIPLAAGVLFFYNGYTMQPMVAAAAMAFSSVSVVLNSLLLKIKKI